MSESAEAGDAPRAQGETAVAAAGGDAAADKPAGATGEPAPIATPNVASLELSPPSETAPAEQTTPVEQRALAEQAVTAHHSPQADQDAPTERTASAAPTASLNEVARLNFKDDAADVADAAPTATKKVLRKKSAKSRVAAKTPRKHRTRVAARFNTRESMFMQPRFLSAPQAFQSVPERTRRADARRTPRTNSAVGGPFVTMPVR